MSGSLSEVSVECSPRHFAFTACGSAWGRPIFLGDRVCSALISQGSQNCLALYHIIAWRVLYLTHLNRASPELPCTAVCQDAEWKSVRCITPLLKQPPRLSQFLPLVAQLGGCNNRATEATPGPQSVWIGLGRLPALGPRLARLWLPIPGYRLRSLPRQLKKGGRGSCRAAEAGEVCYFSRLGGSLALPR